MAKPGEEGESIESRMETASVLTTSESTRERRHSSFLLGWRSRIYIIISIIFFIVLIIFVFVVHAKVSARMGVF